MPFPMELDHCLALAPTGKQLVVRHIPFESLRRSCAQQGVTIGAALRSLGGADGGVLVQRADGATVRLDQRHALFIEVDEYV